MTLAAAQAPALVHATKLTMARQPNHHHHHHHVSSSAPSSAIAPKGLFDLSQLVADGYVGYGGSYIVPSAASRHEDKVRSSAHLLPPPAAAVTPLRLTGREGFVRVQLQKQRVGEQYRATLVGDRIPGFKTSAAFFASLRTNLRLHASPPSSPISTPPSMRSSMTSLPPPSPLSVPSELSDPAVPSDPLADIPELHTFKATTETDQTAALKLIADSVAQMRQTANRALIFHPLNLALTLGLTTFFARWVYNAKQDWSLVGTSCAGVIVALLAGYRWFTHGYLLAAESVNWDWLEGTEVIVTKFGDEVIGAVAVEWLSGESRRQTSKRKKAWRGEIRAWTVRLRYRGKGVGAALLEDAVREARKKGAESLEFALDHANSRRILPMIYNNKFDERERKARELLQDLLEASPTRGGKKR